MPHLFNFQLREIAEIADFFGGEPSHFHWFGLSDGWYWLTVGDDELFRYSHSLVQHEEPWNSSPPDLPYPDYYVVRLWEDILELLPAMLTVVPPTLAERVAEAATWHAWQEQAELWLDRQDSTEAGDIFYRACGWWNARQLSTGYLRYAPSIWFWRTADTMHIRWDNRGKVHNGYPVWTAQAGEYSLSVATFLAEVRAFDARFIAAMGERVAAARAHWPHPDVAIDLDQLAREQPERSGWLTESIARLTQPAAEDWHATLDAIAHIDHATLR